MPVYLTEINSATCIGCGRCYKVCSRDVMHLHGVDEDGKILGIVTEDDEDDFDGELNRKIMLVDNAGACIGCAPPASVRRIVRRSGSRIDRRVGFATGADLARVPPLAASGEGGASGLGDWPLRLVSRPPPTPPKRGEGTIAAKPPRKATQLDMEHGKRCSTSAMPPCAPRKPRRRTRNAAFDDHLFACFLAIGLTEEAAASRR